MFNDFIIVGPPGYPAGIAQASGAVDALRRSPEGLGYRSYGT
jgi:ABC-type tungstate transport system permease subunit